MNAGDFFSYLDSLMHYKIIKFGKNDVLVSNLVFAIFMLFLGAKLHSKVSDLIKSKLRAFFEEDINLSYISERILIFLIWIVYFILLMQTINIPLDSFAFIGGSFAIGIGFGAKNVINNIISSFIILVEKPIKIGDIVTVLGISGKVSDISGLRSVITTENNVDLLIPNSTLFKNSIINYTYNNGKEIRMQSVVNIKNTKYCGSTYLRSILESEIEQIKNDVVLITSIELFLVNVSNGNIRYDMWYSFFMNDFKNISVIRDSICSHVSEELNKLELEFTIEHCKINYDMMQLNTNQDEAGE